MGWQDAPLVQQSPQTGAQTPAWASAPLVNAQQKEPEKPLGGMSDALIEPLAAFGSGIVAQPLSGLAGLAVAGAHKLGLTDKEGADAVRATQDLLTYQPRTKVGEAVTKVASYPFEKLAQGADWAGGKAADVTGSPAVGAGVNTLIQLAPALLAKRGGAPVSTANASTIGSSSAEAAARGFASSNNIHFDSLPDPVKQNLIEIAKDPAQLKQLDAQAVEREARLTALGLPASRGTITRDLGQITSEENLSRSDAGAPLRNISAEQDRILHDHLDALRKATGGAAETPQQLGNSVQGAARAKLQAAKSRVSELYKKADEADETAQKVSTRPLAQLIEQTPDKQHLGWVESWLNKANVVTDEKGQAMAGMRLKAPIRELEDLRQAAVARAMNGGTDAHYAGKVIEAIDQSTDGAGGQLYQAARAARKAQALEFDEQGSVEKLVGNASRTDRKVALEDTFDKVVRSGSNEQLSAVKKTLTEGSSGQVAQKGLQAWKDLQASTLDYLKSKAAGKRAIPGEKSQLQFNSEFIDAVTELDKDGKLDTIFDPATAKKVRELSQATRDIRTKPSDRVAGPNTAPRIISMLEKSIGKVPIAGDMLTGAVRAGIKLHEIGKNGREVGQAVSSPLNSAASRVKRAKTNEAAVSKFAPYTLTELQSMSPEDRRKAIAEMMQ
jgi:hypothetical protein